MDDNKKERLMISIISVSALGNIAEILLARWEGWMIPVVIIGVFGIWWLHIIQKSDMITRTNVYFVFASFLAFFHGIHGMSYYDVSIVALILMATFMVTDRITLLNLIMLEYIGILTYQLIMMHNDHREDINHIMLIRTLLHAGVVICMYLLSRILINNRKTSNEKLDRWKEAVEENNHDMEDFLSNISHELRTPVNVISGMTTLLQKTIDRDELDSIKEAGIRLAHQIEDIQDYTEIKRGELVLEEENYMCLSLINDVISNYKANDNKNNLEFIVDLAPETPTLLKGDIQKLHKLFRHLLDNAIKFTRNGGIYIKVFSVPQEYGANLTIEVADTGVGMTRSQISRLSKGMYQANKKRNRSTGGIGIGLPIVYGFVHKMGGFVRINSVKGRGTTIRLTIPQGVVDTSPCLSVQDDLHNNIVFYVMPEKYRSPRIREFYSNITTNLATGLKIDIYSANEKRELERLVNDLSVSHIFTGQEEYDKDKDFLDKLANEGIKVIVTVKDEYKIKPNTNIITIPKPLYAFPVVRILNGETDGLVDEGVGKIQFDNIKALIVDDEPMNLVVASGILRDYNMIVDTAESGKEAIDKYTNGEYDVIYMDHMMPEMDGVEAMKNIRQVADETGRKPIVIALTANALSGAREMFIREGFDGFIAKPIDIAEFERVMKRELPEDLINSEGRA